jgi:ribokinase
MSDQIVVIGSSNTDFVMKMDRLPRKGETVTNAVFVQTFGGKGANTAVGAARAGGNVAFVNGVGDDAFGAMIIENMRRAGVQTDGMLQAEGIASGSALIMIDANGDNYLSVAPGANYRLTADHIVQLAGLVAQSAMVMLQYEILPETLYAAIDLASDMQKPILFNYAPARTIDESYLAKISYLVVNEVEAESLCGFPVNSSREAQAATTALLDKGPRAAIITLGGRGVVAAERSGAFSVVPAYAADVVDTTAAGDIFCGALAVALVEGRSLEQSIHFANAAAAISVGRLGAQPSAPSRQEIDAFMRTVGPA